MVRALPSNWVEVQLIELLETLENGSRPKGGVQGILDGIPSLGGEHLNSDGGFKFNKVKFVPFEFAEKMLRGKIQTNDILIVKDGATTGKTSYVDNSFPYRNAFVNEHVFICRSLKEINSKCLYYFLWGKTGQERILENFTGSAQGGINQKFAQNTLIPLPPLAEQNRIVEKLDVLFGHLEQIKIKLDKVPTLLKNFRQAVLNQAVTGKLTEEWREGRELENIFTDSSKTTMRKPTFSVPENWKWLPFDVVATIKSNLVDPNKYLEFPLIAPDNIQSETGRLINKPLVSDIMPKSSKHYFNNGAIVYSKIRPYLSKLIIADFDGLCSADMYPIESKIDIKYLFFYMLSEIFLSYATTAGERTVLPKINQKGVNIIPVPVPALEEQQEIVKRVKSLFAKADKIEKQYQTLKEKIDTLPQALLAKAFKGELVEQLPIDGDARELLEQIRQAKAGLSKSGKTETKRSKSKKLKADEELDVAAEPKGRYGK